MAILVLAILLTITFQVLTRELFVETWLRKTDNWLYDAQYWGSRIKSQTEIIPLSELKANLEKIPSSVHDGSINFSWTDPSYSNSGGRRVVEVTLSIPVGHRATQSNVGENSENNAKQVTWKFALAE